MHDAIILIFMKLGAKELRHTRPNEEDLKKIKRNPIYLLLDNVLDTYNVGSIFRLADAVAAKRVYLCGETLTPPNPRIKKASINTTEWVSWEYADSAVNAILKIKDQIAKSKNTHKKLKLIAVEQDPRAVPYDQTSYELPIAIVVGNETYGVSREVLDIADQIVEIPMWGVNKSLNVHVSCSLVVYEAMKQLYSA